MKILLFTFILVSLSYSVPVEDITTLEQFYNALDGPNWTEKDSWLSGDPCDDNWFGITCDLTGDNIVFIELAENGLAGIFPSDFSISSLQILYVIYIFNQRRKSTKFLLQEFTR